jgi:hypothetical protein
MAKRKLVVFCIILFIASLIGNVAAQMPGYRDDETELATSQKIKERLKLTISPQKISRNSVGEITSLSLKAEIKNISDQEVYFYFEKCTICFWEISINGRGFEQMAFALHDAPCPYSNLVKLTPGGSIINEDYLTITMPSERWKEITIKTIKLRYMFSRDPNLYLESNELRL